jgi:hypothetical protein
MKKLVIITLFCCFAIASRSQGRVVINEFMPWTANTCGASTGEFVELLNFGPGPIDIGCYILTDGDYSITIPPNTILQPGEFYVIAGQTVITAPCANIDSTITADLNWNTCNCTSAPIPTAGDGFFTDGGSANEQVVLLSPSLTVMDAVVRSMPVETSSLITTSSVGGQCTQRTFDLDLMTINYETIGESAGRANSFARKLDGDCGWVKDPQQSGNATNNTPSDISDISYSFAVTRSTACPDDGSIGITVNGPNVASVFPINYTIAYDSDSDNVFELSDSYTQGSSSTPNTVNVGNFIPGNYRITVGSALGCNLKTFPFVILDCGPVLPVNLISFTVSKTTAGFESRWTIDNPENLEKIIIEKSTDGLQFQPAGNVYPPANSNGQWSSAFQVAGWDNPGFFRLQMVAKNGAKTWSPVVAVLRDQRPAVRSWPNPVRNELFTEVTLPSKSIIRYAVFNTNNQLVLKGEKIATEGTTLFSIPSDRLLAGTYQIVFETKDIEQVKPIVVRFVKL